MNEIYSNCFHIDQHKIDSRTYHTYVKQEVSAIWLGEMQ